jgi:DNA-directed RNA polymerase specialized sigma subunit
MTDRDILKAIKRLCVCATYAERAIYLRDVSDYLDSDTVARFERSVDRIMPMYQERLMAVLRIALGREPTTKEVEYCSPYFLTDEGREQADMRERLKSLKEINEKPPEDKDISSSN